MINETPRTDAILSKIPGGSTCDPQLVADEIRGDIAELERELEQERQDRKQADLDAIRALGERNDARAELDRLESELTAAKEVAAAEFCQLNRDLTRQSEQAERHRVALLAERALADRLAETMGQIADGCGDAWSADDAKVALAAWKEARRGTR